MNIYLAGGIILLLIVIILLLSIGLYVVIKKATYLSKKQKEFIIFAIDMYVEYAEELDIVSPEKHEQIVKQLKQIKERYLI
jgi:competence protein ComGF